MNREIFPGGIYPLQGDVVSQAGGSTVQIAKIQGTPVSSSVPVAGNYFIFDGINWTDHKPWNDTIEINGFCISDDWNITINQPKPIKINGV